MKKLRCFLFAATLIISAATFASAGDIQMPGKSDPAPTSTPIAITTMSTNDGGTQPTSTEQDQIAWQDASTLLVEILLTIF